MREIKEDVNLIAEYRDKLFTDGYVHVKQLLKGEGLELLVKAINANMEKPSPFGRSNIGDSTDGQFFMDFNNWKRIPEIKELCYRSEIVDLVTQITNSNKCWLFHDHVLVKSGKAPATPTHQDLPYYVAKGDLNLSVWITANNVSKDSGLFYYSGTHKLKQLYMPKSFIDGKDIEANDNFDIIDDNTFKDYPKHSFDMEAGDAIIFFHNTVHGAHPHNSEEPRRALSIRYLLDGATLTKKYINATPPYDRMGLKIEEDAPIPENFFPLVTND